MSKKSERFEKLDRACEKLFQAQGENFRVKDLAREAEVSNTIAGPHKDFWLYRRAQEAHFSSLTARTEAEPPRPQSDVAVLCEVANRANANVLALVETVNKLIAVFGNVNMDRRPAKSRSTITEVGSERADIRADMERGSGSRLSDVIRRNEEIKVDEIPQHAIKQEENLTGADTVAVGGLDRVVDMRDLRDSSSLRGPEFDHKNEEDAPETPAQPDTPSMAEESPLAEPTARTAETHETANISGNKFPRGVSRPQGDSQPEEIDAYNNSTDPLRSSCVEDLPVVDSEAAPLSLRESGVPASRTGQSPSPGAAPDLSAPFQINFDFCSAERYASVDPLRHEQPLVDARATPVITAPPIEIDDCCSGASVMTFPFVEEVAESVLVRAPCALSAPEIYSQLPTAVRGRYSRRYFSELLRGSTRLHYDEAGKKFYVKFTSADGSSVPIHLALTSAAASILRDAEGSVRSEIIYSRLESDLRSKVAPQALQSMLLVGAAATPLIEANQFGEWRLAGRAVLNERRPNGKRKYPQLEREVKQALQIDNRPMRGVDIHRELSPELQRQFPEDKMSRHLQNVKGIFQMDGKKWWLSTTRAPKREEPLLDPEKSDRAGRMAIAKLVTDEAERIVARSTGEMTIDKILVEVQKRFKVDDKEKFARALNSRRKAKKAKIVRLSDGVYRALRADEF
jgi:hypothetical protein